MRHAYLTLLLPLALLFGCKGTTKIGASCHADGDCNVAGQKCVASICTHACAGQFGDQGCPIGFNCTAATPGAGLTCNKVPFSVDDGGVPLLFDKSCSTDSTVCDSTGDPNPTPSCRKAEDPTMPGKPIPGADAHAYCTGVCATDGDCPFNMYCGADYDGAMKCLERQQCADCQYDDNCPANFACATTPKDMKKYCLPRCNAQYDCPGAAQSINYLTCDLNVGVCIPKYGSCVGGGEICDPCRVKADCAKTSTSCITNDLTGESMCSKRCSDDTTCAGPNGATCDDTDIPSASNPSGMSIGICTGDKMHMFPGVFSCWGIGG
ncbi:MAG: hypothetical protein ACHQ17_03725 [Polyangia bacterium]|jgi:hypothetical protein